MNELTEQDVFTMLKHFQHNVTSKLQQLEKKRGNNYCDNWYSALVHGFRETKGLLTEQASTTEVIVCWAKETDDGMDLSEKLKRLRQVRSYFCYIKVFDEFFRRWTIASLAQLTEEEDEADFVMENLYLPFKKELPRQGANFYYSLVKFCQFYYTKHIAPAGSQ
jgi:hypothetical protein